MRRAGRRRQQATDGLWVRQLARLHLGGQRGQRLGRGQRWPLGAARAAPGAVVGVKGRQGPGVAAPAQQLDAAGGQLQLHALQVLVPAAGGRGGRGSAGQRRAALQQLCLQPAPAPTCAPGDAFKGRRRGHRRQAPTLPRARPAPPRCARRRTGRGRAGRRRHRRCAPPGRSPRPAARRAARPPRPPALRQQGAAGGAGVWVRVQHGRGGR